MSKKLRESFRKKGGVNPFPPDDAVPPPPPPPCKHRTDAGEARCLLRNKHPALIALNHLFLGGSVIHNEQIWRMDHSKDIYYTYLNGEEDEIARHWPGSFGVFIEMCKKLSEEDLRRFIRIEQKMSKSEELIEVYKKALRLIAVFSGNVTVQCIVKGMLEDPVKCLEDWIEHHGDKDLE